MGFNIEKIDAVRDRFNPHCHEALANIPSDEPEGTVVSQHCAGYKIGDRLIRPAQVMVSSGPKDD